MALDPERFVGRTVVGTLWDPPRIVLDDGSLLLVKDVKRDADGNAVELVVEPAPAQPWLN